MTVILDADSIRACTQGTIVQRDTATLPQSTDGALFTITGGQILLLALWGEVTTVIETKANNTKIKFNPTATGADTDLCAALNITGKAVGTIFSITGTVSDALQSGLLCGNVILAKPLLLSEGDIELDCAASSTGSVAWNIIYVALDSEGTVAAA
ncbi:hypothetical protein AMK68_00120 [candidate division KD3-62 bacterium DG_56]|uniref:Uncharacterized protein n=1 Tax=candidate division KD3-62 bacterium DG_56 TaxID=1704032 RepID=A0A0S7XR26_9BACT|nr:MAG: hypothetical protein AMK68_00120 [candidate division KD3-62 bacterium DG_56]